MNCNQNKRKRILDPQLEKFKLLLMIAAFFYVFCLSLLLSEAKVTEWVQRRPSHDIYSFINLSHQTCESNTFLIEENQCVQDQELYEGCSDSVVPDLSSDLVAFVYLHLNPSNVAYFLVENENTNGRFYFNGTNQSVDDSDCQIDSLEVYRGRRQAIEISHEGFSLTENGTVQINKAQLAYSLNEYGGELYRFNVSCLTETQPRRGCLFFKVRGQQLENYITNAKFNCTVPGTVSDFFDECNITKTAVTGPSTSVSSTMYVATTTVNVPTDVLGLGLSIVILILAIVIVGTVLFGINLFKRKRQILTITTASESQQENPSTVEHLEELQRNSHDIESAQQANVYAATQDTESVEDTNEINMPHTNSNTSLSIHLEPKEHVYAVLEETQLSEASIVFDPGQIVQSQMPPEATDQGAVQDTCIQITQNSDSTTGTTTTHQSKVRLESSLREFVQIYDRVAPEMVVYDEICHPMASQPSRKRSLPANLAILQCSIATPSSLWQSGSSLATTNHGGVPPLYSVPDMKKKREAHLKKIQHMDREARMEALRKISSTSCPPFLLTGVESDCPIPAYINHAELSQLEEHYQNQTKTPNQIVTAPGGGESVYDEPISLNLVQRKNKTTL